MSVKEVDIPTSDWIRTSSQEADLRVKNRFLEQNPTLHGKGSAIARPGMRYWTTVGTGPIRKLFQQPGVFDDDAFAASGRSLYRLDRENVLNVELFDALSNDARLAVSMCAAGYIGDDYHPKLWFADGERLRFYSENANATATITITGVPGDAGTIAIRDTYYEWVNSVLDLNTGTPDGTVGNPWKVYNGASNVEAANNLARAINAELNQSTYHSSATTSHSHVFAEPIDEVPTGDPVVIVLRSIEEGTVGNIITMSEASTNLTVSGGFFTGGGDTDIVVVPMPEEASPVDICTLNSYIIVVPWQVDKTNGRFYWIEPGASVIEALNFATAERLPDAITDANVFNGNIWFMGQSVTEAWYATGDQDTPFAPLQGVVFERGVHEHTAVEIKNAIVTVDTTGGVWAIGAGTERISTPAIEERLRAAINRQRTLTF